MSSSEKSKEKIPGTGDEENARNKFDGDATSHSEDKAETSSSNTDSDLSHMLESKLKVEEKVQEDSLLDEVTFEGIARYILSDRCKNIVTMAGAGISTSAGIPDFRSPGTGLYDNLEKYNLPEPHAVFDISYFKTNPEPFFVLCKDLYPKQAFKPTPCHYFIKLLEKKNKLLTHFTQNIDTLERVSGLSDGKVVEAHGSFNTGHCRKCNAQYEQEWMRERIFSEDVVPRCTQKDCDGIVKPDIVFFGESLPDKFRMHIKDMEECDLLIILGTSLVVQPFASLTGRTRKNVPRLYINMERTKGGGGDFFSMLFGGGSNFDFDNPDNIRDVFWQGKCDEGCQALADLLGWGEELKTLVCEEHARLELEMKATASTQPKAKV
ncbi:NAD-dependent protein deacetylase sirtuin-2-like [Dreissena polymorpha]|uniref:NAD-dependent protein deacetylase n=1 Tax=Dreissena polymorpha TaxID=45954 RepID=A0A9D4L5E3_DREPO|nr:NAD-dependent protein deacetylase sirtuin-2-like [Dreissena polymorpha]KAH3852320.1 hypothetical protein DPMN_094825 [Dreissena polymorpha]